ncbi:MAG: endonuclease/exonuclease/phosphatase family protein [Candidatus Sericytochromatia bacterium]
MAFDDPASWQPWLRSPGYQALATLAWLGLLILAVCSLLPHLAWAHKLELASHFRFQFALLCLLLPPIFLGLRQGVPVLLALLLVCWNGWEIAPWYLGDPKPNPGLGKPLKLLMSNMLYTNPDTSRLQALIEQEKPDVVVIEELSWRQVNLMTELAKAYPYQIHDTFQGAFGIGIWSRWPLAEAQQLMLGPVPSLYARLDWDGQPVHLLATHPFPPVDEVAFKERNRQYQAIRELLKSKPGEQILLGDLNITPWSPYYRQLVESTGLYNARRGFGLTPTWPTNFPPLLRIPIDHALLSPSLKVLKWQTGPELGSDHLPILLSIIRS